MRHAVSAENRQIIMLLRSVLAYSSGSVGHSKFGQGEELTREGSEGKIVSEREERLA